MKKSKAQEPEILVLLMQEGTPFVLRPSKWALMTPNAGAMAAPAMTVSRLMERMVYSNLFFIIYGLKINGDCSSTKLRKEPFRGCKGSNFFYKI